jgi:exosortase/archaeosortase family protein
MMQNLKGSLTLKLSMRSIVQKAKKTGRDLLTTIKNPNVITTMLLVVSFVVPFSILYVLEPGLFQATWIGRTFYLFFLWLVILEMILNWNGLQSSRLKKLMAPRTLLFIIVLILPTLYVVWANFFGLNTIIRNLALQNNMSWGNALLMRIPVEYLVFTLLFSLMVILAYGIRGLKGFSTSILFLGIIGTLYAIDTMYPGNTFSPFEILVPATTQLSAIVLHLMGYQTSITVANVVQNGVNYGVCPTLTAANMNTGAIAQFTIAWACSGIESLLIYAVVLALFLKAISIRGIYKIALYVMGAFITYFINILRVVTFFVLSFNGASEQTISEFHNYYGPLYSVIWITSYPLIIMGISALSIRFINASTKAEQLNSVVSETGR